MKAYRCFAIAECPRHRQDATQFGHSTRCLEYRIGEIEADRAILQRQWETQFDKAGRLHGEVEIFRLALHSACESIGAWGAYAGEYFQQKWDLKNDCLPETHLRAARESKTK